LHRKAFWQEYASQRNAATRRSTPTLERMNASASSAAKLALYGGAMAGPMSVAAILLGAAARIRTGVPVSPDAAIAVVGLFFGVMVSLCAGLPVFLLLLRAGLLNASLVVAWSAVLGAFSYHALFMWGAPPDWWWVSIGAIAGALSSAIAMLLLEISGKRGQSGAL